MVVDKSIQRSRTREPEIVAMKTRHVTSIFYAFLGFFLSVFVDQAIQHLSEPLDNASIFPFVPTVGLGSLVPVYLLFGARRISATACNIYKPLEIQHLL